MKYLRATLLTALLAVNASALPMLQLDVAGGTYNEETESISIEADVFNIYALLNTLTPAGPYYISAGLAHVDEDGGFSPVAKGTPAPELGTFTFAGITVSAAAGMDWGKPFLMPPHGTFDTYYSQFTFNFDGTAGPSSSGPPILIGAAPTAVGRLNNYNAQETGHVDLVNNPSGNGMYAMFTVDITNLDLDTAILFDFYTYAASGKKLKIMKAPFSHNAEGTGEEVPEGGSTLILLGVAAALGAAARRHAARRAQQVA